jgi:hypothetical protein
VVITADAADAAGDEVGVSGVLAFHEYAVAAEQRGCALALHDFPVGKVDLCVDAQVSDDSRDWIPSHFDDVGRLSLDWFSDSHLKILS